MYTYMYIPPLKTNISPENWWLEEDSFPFSSGPFSRELSFIFGGNTYTPGTQMTSIFEGQPRQTRPKLEPKEGSTLASRYVYVYIFLLGLFHRLF